MDLFATGTGWVSIISVAKLNAANGLQHNFKSLAVFS